MVTSNAVRELVWLQRLSDELTQNQFKITDFYMDNQAAIRLVKNPEFHKRSKHIDVKYHFTREKFNDGLFTLNYVKSEEQLADIFTKALPKMRFQYLRAKLGITSIKSKQM